jgi:hypothetical protein
VVLLAADQQVMQKSEKVLKMGDLAQEYGLKIQSSVVDW